MDKQQYLEIELNQLPKRTQVLFDEGHRLVQIGCTKTSTNLEVNYSFDKNYDFLNLKLILPLQNPPEIPSISPIYPNAFLYENEIHDLYGLNIKNISIDYKGTFYQTAMKTPFNTKEEPKK